jgi:N-acylmannosamine kinase
MSVSGYAVDLGGTKIAVAHIRDGRVEARGQGATRGGADLWGQMEAIGALLADVGYQSGEPLGVAVAGRIDRDGNWHAVNTDTLSAIKAAPLRAMLRDRFGTRVSAINDAAAAALAESRMGAGQGAYNFAYLTVSTGVGGGLVLAGKLLDSNNGLAGHVGFSSSPLSHARCGSGRLGTVESIAGGRAIAAAAGLPDAKAVFARDPQDAAIVRSAQAIARLVADLTAVLGLDAVAIGGGIGLAPGYLPLVLSHLDEEPTLFRPRVTLAQLGTDSGLVGALLHSLEVT